jgi:hypothetical protein
MHHFIQISDCHIDDTEQSLGVNTHQNLLVFFACTELTLIISHAPIDILLNKYAGNTVARLWASS